MTTYNTQPLVSVIIPCYNYGKYLPYAINSVLEQTGEGFTTEIIVVDDGSKDNTAEIAQGFGSPVRYIYQENQGPSAARNTGIRNASGSFIIFLDADDLLGPNVIDAHLKNFSAKPELDLSICHCYNLNEDTGSASLWPIKAAHLDIHFCNHNIAPVHAFMTRCQVIDEAGFFDTERKACEDYDYWLRCARLGKRFAPAHYAFVIYRHHGHSLSSCHNHMLLKDISVREDLENRFNATPPFPKAGSYYGRLAYAAGLLGSAAELRVKNPQLALQVIDRSAKALLEGAKVYPKESPADRHLIQAERYYALNCFIHANKIGNDFTPALKRATAFIQARYPNVVNGPMDKLTAKLTNLNIALMADYSSVQTMLKDYKIPEA